MKVGGIKVDFRGFEELGAKLEKMIDAEIKVREVVKKNGAEMNEKIQRYAPVDTGTLKRNINLEIKDNGLTAEVNSGPTEYSVYQEYGTRYQSGTPHFRPGFEDQKPICKEDMKKVMQK